MKKTFVQLGAGVAVLCVLVFACDNQLSLTVTNEIGFTKASGDTKREAR